MRKDNSMTDKKHATHNKMNSIQFDILFAYERLLANQPITKIKIEDICQEAHVSRTTFYRYFKSKTEIILWFADHALLYGVCQIGRGLSWYEGFFNTYSLQYQHSILYSRELEHKDNKLALNKFSKHTFRKALLSTLVSKGVPITEKLSYQVDFVAAGTGTIDRRWVNEGMVIPPEALAKYMAESVPRELFEALETTAPPQ